MKERTTEIYRQAFLGVLYVALSKASDFTGLTADELEQVAEKLLDDAEEGLSTGKEVLQTLRVQTAVANLRNLGG